MMKFSLRIWVSLIGIGASCVMGLQARAQTPAYPVIPPYVPPAPVAQQPYGGQGVYVPSSAPSAMSTSDPGSLSDAVRLNPFDPVALNNLAVHYASMGDYANAVPLLERALRLAPTRTDIASNLQNLRGWMSQGAAPPFNAPAAGFNAMQPHYVQAQDLPPMWSAPAGTRPSATPSNPRQSTALPIPPSRVITESRSSSAGYSGSVVEGPTPSSAPSSSARRSSSARKHRLTRDDASMSSQWSSESPTPKPRKRLVRQRLVLDCPPT